MKHLLRLVFIGTIALSFLSPISSAFADQDFHSQQLPWFLTPEGAAVGHPELRSDHVVDVHANGPQIGAIERYLINGAKPNTTYEVWLEIFTGSCDGDEVAFSPLFTRALGTNEQGNAQDGTVFPAEALDGLAGVYGILWTLVDEEGTIAYETPCIVVTVD